MAGCVQTVQTVDAVNGVPSSVSHAFHCPFSIESLKLRFFEFRSFQFHRTNFSIEKILPKTDPNKSSQCRSGEIVRKSKNLDLSFPRLGHAGAEEGGIRT